MKSAWVFLAACWSPEPMKPAPPPAAMPVAVKATRASTYELPAAVSDALAAEKLAGNVLVPANATLYASASAARKDREDPRGRATAMRVVADHGEVVEVSTGAAQDCVGDWSQPYDLRVFVARAKLIPRASASIVKTFADGSAVAIDRGAPVELSEKGLHWDESAFHAGIAPAADRLVLSVPPGPLPSALPPAGERLLCENDQVMTSAERAAVRQRAYEAREKERAERRRVLLEERRAERARTKPAPARKKPQDIVQPVKIEPYIRDRELGLDDDEPLAKYDDRFEPWCSIGEPYGSSAAKPPAPALDGHALAWPYEEGTIVTRQGTRYFADIEETCGRVRVVVTREALRDGGMGGVAGGILGGALVKVWVPSPGKVTWRDGSPAGTYAGGKQYREVTEEPGRICVHVEDVAELVCHDKSTAKTEMVSPWGL
jgi:hypothetical protein